MLLCDTLLEGCMGRCNPNPKALTLGFKGSPRVLGLFMARYFLKGSWDLGTRATKRRYLNWCFM